MRNQQKAAERKAKREAEGGTTPAKKKGGKKRAAPTPPAADDEDEDEDDIEQEHQGEDAHSLRYQSDLFMSCESACSALHSRVMLLSLIECAARQLV